MDYLSYKTMTSRTGRSISFALIMLGLFVSISGRSNSFANFSPDDKFELFSSDCSKIKDNVPIDVKTDFDEDKIDDLCEQLLAERFAPIVIHSSDESNFPTNVDSFLLNTSLEFFSISKPALDRKIKGKPSQTELLNQRVEIPGTPSVWVSSNGTRSQFKETGFFLRDVDDEFRKGSLESQEWVTYYHTDNNDVKGITIQYWRFYAYNDALNNHGGDWEGIHIILDENLQPIRVGLLGHTSIEYKAFVDMEKEGDHVRVFSEGGGHGTRPKGDGIQAKNCGKGFLESLVCHIDLSKQSTFVRQETWTNGGVIWFDGKKSKTGKLINLGSKQKPMNGQVFIQYSGLWGSPSKFFESPTYYSFSGYWGPAFNETAMTSENFITAWCGGLSNTKKEECFPTSIIR